MDYRYVILGAGRQGTACAYDLARHGRAREIVLADSHEDFIRKSLERLKSIPMAGSGVEFRPAVVSVEDHDNLVKILRGADAVLSAVPYFLNPAVARAAVAAGVSLCDLGGDTPTTLAIREMDREAKEAGVRIFPDCGLAPGMNNILAAYGMGRLDRTDSVRIWCGGLPQEPVPPLGYRLVFNLEGLLNNYFGKAFVIRNGRATEIESFTDCERVDFPPPLGVCEAFVTAGATSTCPWTFEGKIRDYDYKTVRYPGHYERIRLLRDLGLLGTDPVRVKGRDVVPRDVVVRVVGDRISHRDIPDLVVLRVVCRGVKAGKNAEVVLELLDFYDEGTGFLAMERTTGFSVSIVMIMLAQGRIPAVGVLAPESDVPAALFVDELRKRGFSIREDVRPYQESLKAGG